MTHGSSWDSMFMPHGQCFLWQPGVLWLNVISDGFITVAYYLISAALFYFLVKRHDVPFRWMFALFGLFIFACGTTHAMHVWTVWHPDYWEEGLVKAGTAALSFVTGLLLVPLLPKAMALRSPLELEAVNTDLRLALHQRQEAIATLEQSEAVLRRRTEELTHQRQRLRHLAIKLNTTEQRERRRLATDLHDYLAQMLVVCRLKVAQAKGRLYEQPDSWLDDLNAGLDECLGYTRTLVSQLCPTALYESGVMSALQQLATQLDKQGLRVTVTMVGAQPALSEDNGMLVYQTVRELLYNTLKHAHTAEAEVRLEQTPGGLAVVVHDHGRGFDAHGEGPGRGFGLFNIRERIEALGGEFLIESGPGMGTKAVFQFPVAAGTHPVPETTSVPAQRETSLLLKETPGMTTVLLVDDHAMVRQGLRSILEGYSDITVLGEACNGEEALNCVDALSPDIIIMDVNMPRMDGITATRLIKARHPMVTIVGLSVNADVQNETAMMEAGAALLLTKEAAVEQLYTAIKQAQAKTDTVMKDEPQGSP